MTGEALRSLPEAAENPADLLRRMAHLSPDEVGAVFLLLLHAASGADLPDEAGLAQLTRLGGAWFRRPPGGEQTRGARIMAAAGIVRQPSAGISDLQLAQRKAAAARRWEVVRGAGQMQLPLAAAPGSGPPPIAPGPVLAPPRPAPETSPPPLAAARPYGAAAAAAAAAMAQRPDAGEISDTEAIDYVRGWLVQWTGFKRAFPDDNTCRNVLAAAPGRSLCEIYGALSSRFRARIPPGNSWGWFVVVVRNHFAAAAVGGGGGHGPAAAVAR